jgi:hypothetical protein
MKRIIAYCMYEGERAAALRYLTSTRDAGSYVVGDIDEVDIPALQRAGLVFEEISGVPAGETRAGARAVLPHARTRTRRAGAPTVVVPPAAPPQTAFRVLIFDLRLHRAEDAAAMHDWLEKRRAIIARTSQRKLRVYLPEDSPLIDDIPAMKEVASFEQCFRGPALTDLAYRAPQLESASPRL